MNPGQKVRLKRSFSFPMERGGKHTGDGVAIDRTQEFGKIIRRLSTGEWLVEVRGHEFAVSRKEIGAHEG